jgi:hypothetical protein
MPQVLDRLLRVGEGRKAKKLQKVADAVLELHDEVEALSDEQLKAKTDEFRTRLADGETVDDIQVEAFAVVREAAWRVLHQKPFPVQVFGGVVLHDNNIAEMKTGEGKTLTSTLPVFLNTLAGDSVHVVTVNDYLARRDAAWMGRLYNWLGLSVGVLAALPVAWLEGSERGLAGRRARELEGACRDEDQRQAGPAQQRSVAETAVHDEVERRRVQRRDQPTSRHRRGPHGEPVVPAPPAARPPYSSGRPTCWADNARGPGPAAGGSGELTQGRESAIL